MVPQEYNTLVRIICFALLNAGVYLTMSYYAKHQVQYTSLVDYMNGDEFVWKDAGQFIAMLIALSVFIYMALGKFTSNWSELRRSLVAGVTVPLLIVILYFSI